MPWIGIALSLVLMLGALRADAGDKKKPESTERPVEHITLNYGKIDAAEGKDGELAAPASQKTEPATPKASKDVQLKGKKIKEN